MFVLRPIEDPQVRADFEADYYLSDLSAPRQMHCLSRDPKESGLVTDATYVAGEEGARRYCFELPEKELD